MNGDIHISIFDIWTHFNIYMHRCLLFRILMSTWKCFSAYNDLPKEQFIVKLYFGVIFLGELLTFEEDINIKQIRGMKISRKICTRSTPTKYFCYYCYHRFPWFRNLFRLNQYLEFQFFETSFLKTFMSYYKKKINGSRSFWLSTN